MTQLRNISQISDGDRLFYELGMYVQDNWIRRGIFKEITNVAQFVSNDKLCNKLLHNLEYLEHHNFMIIKKEI